MTAIRNLHVGRQFAADVGGKREHRNPLINLQPLYAQIHIFLLMFFALVLNMFGEQIHRAGVAAIEPQIGIEVLLLVIVLHIVALVHRPFVITNQRLVGENIESHYRVVNIGVGAKPVTGALPDVLRLVKRGQSAAQHTALHGH